MHGIVDSKQCLTEPVAQVVFTLYLASLSIASPLTLFLWPRQDLDALVRGHSWKDTYYSSGTCMIMWDHLDPMVFYWE